MVGEFFGGYRIEGLIGRGGMGVVYRAEQVALGRPVALKVIAPEFSADPDFRARFDRESRMAASIDHPNVVPVYEAGQVGSTAFLAMRFIDGTDLRSLIARDGGLTPQRATGIVAQVAAALDAAHGRGLVHRDVKPANVLVAGWPATPHAYLTDFGLTKDTGSQSGLTATGHWLGTLDYVAPEQVEGGAVDARVDVYSLGCVLYEALTGRVPFPRERDVAKLYAHAHEAPPRVSDARPGLPAALDQVVSRALAKDPADRYPSAGDLGRAAHAAVAGDDIRTPERSVAAGAAAPLASASRVGTRLDSGSPGAPHEPALTPPTRLIAGRRGRDALALALIVAAVLVSAAAVAVALIATGREDGSRAAVGDRGSQGAENGGGSRGGRGARKVSRTMARGAVGPKAVIRAGRPAEWRASGRHETATSPLTPPTAESARERSTAGRPTTASRSRWPKDRRNACCRTNATRAVSHRAIPRSASARSRRSATSLVRAGRARRVGSVARALRATDGRCLATEAVRG